MDNNSPSFTVFDDYAEFNDAWETAADKRHPGVNSRSYRERFTDAELDEYDQLNEKLHTAIRNAAVQQFGETGAEELTYQNWDWYGPSFECYVGVINGHLTSDFLMHLQAILKGEFEHWIIVAKLWGDFMDAATEGEEVVIFSDRVLFLRESFHASGLE